MKKILMTFILALVGMISTTAFVEALQATGTTTSTLSSIEDNQDFGRSIGTQDAIEYYEGLYLYQPSENTVMYFSINQDYGKTACLNVLSTTESSAIIPDSIHFISPNGNSLGTYPVVIISDYFDVGYIQPFPFPSQLTTLTIPSTVKYYRSYNPQEPVDQYIETVYLLGDACSYSTADTICAKYAYVCDKSKLQNILSNNLYSNTEILPYGWEFASDTINVNSSGEFSEIYLTQNDYDWGAIQNLKVTGNINSIDLNAIKRLTSLMKLDISETNVSEIPDDYMARRYSLTEVKLPSTINKIGKSAFSYCKRLKSISLSGIQEIETNAFKNCNALNNIDLSTAKFIGYSAFYGCSSLETVSLDSAIVVGNMYVNSDYYDNEGLAFENCVSLKSVNWGNQLRRIGKASFKNTALNSLVLPEGIENIPEEAFYNCSNLEYVKLPSTLKMIMSSAFFNCTSLTDISLQDGLTDIGNYAFYNCNSLEKSILPATIRTIGLGAFYGTSLNELICFAAIPPIVPPYFVGGMNLDRAVLYVPSFSKQLYRNNENWSIFSVMKPIENEIDYILVNRPLSINVDDNNTAAANSTLDLRYDGSYTDENNTTQYYIGQLTATGEGTLSVGQMTVSGQLSSRSRNSFQYMPTLINYTDKMRADNITHNLTFYNYSGSGEWHFISLPYDVKVSDIVPGDNTYWVIRRYDSAARATGTSDTWVNLTNDDILEAGKGYIVSAIDGYDEYGRYFYPTLSFTSGNSITKNNLFRSTDIIVPLTEYAAEFAHNRSWNLIGNPYPCYFDMHYLGDGFTAPITVWNGNSYVAYSPVDDDLVLSPYEAFFVQCPLNATEMTFKENGRIHSNVGKDLYKVASTSRETVSAEGRNVFNFILSQGSYGDRARIVLNAEAKSEYEIGRDASKFFAENSELAQIYVSSDVNYSISERPVGDGRAALGLRAYKEDTYSLSLSGRYSSEWHVIVTDNTNGVSVDLTQNDYNFTATVGDSYNRFSVRFQLGNQSGIESMIADFGNDTSVTVTALNGQQVYSGRLSELKVPSAGIYVISNGQETRKLILK